jgi:hypothetical protein
VTRGPVPNPDRQRRNAPTIAETELGSAPIKSELVPKIPRRAWQKLHVETRAWWNDVVAAPQASQYGRTDWRRLKMVVLPLCERLNRAIEAKEPDDALIVKLADAFARQEREFGLTPDARQRMRWVIRPDAPASSPEESAKPASKRKPQTVRTDPRLKLVDSG